MMNRKQSKHLLLVLRMPIHPEINVFSVWFRLVNPTNLCSVLSDEHSDHNLSYFLLGACALEEPVLQIVR